MITQCPIIDNWLDPGPCGIATITITDHEELWPLNPLNGVQRPAREAMAEGDRRAIPTGVPTAKSRRGECPVAELVPQAV